MAVKVPLASKLLARIADALQSDSLTDSVRESLLEQIKAVIAKPAATPKVNGKSLLAIAGYSKDLIPFWEQYEQRDGIGILHRQGRPGWKVVKDSQLATTPCFCCRKALGFGKLAIVAPREGFRLAHYGCSLNWNFSRPTSIAQVITDCATAARIAFVDGAQSVYVPATPPIRCRHSYIAGECDRCVLPCEELTHAVYAGQECAQAICRTMRMLDRDDAGYQGRNEHKISCDCELCEVAA